MWQICDVERFSFHDPYTPDKKKGVKTTPGSVKRPREANMRPTETLGQSLHHSDLTPRTPADQLNRPKGHIRAPFEARNARTVDRGALSAPRGRLSVARGSLFAARSTRGQSECSLRHNVEGHGDNQEGFSGNLRPSGAREAY